MITVRVSEFYRNFNLYKDYYIKTVKTGGRAPFLSGRIAKVINCEQRRGNYSDIYYNLYYEFVLNENLYPYTSYSSKLIREKVEYVTPLSPIYLYTKEEIQKEIDSLIALYQNMIW